MPNTPMGGNDIILGLGVQGEPQVIAALNRVKQTAIGLAEPLRQAQAQFTKIAKSSMRIRPNQALQGVLKKRGKDVLDQDTKDKVSGAIEARMKQTAMIAHALTLEETQQLKVARIKTQILNKQLNTVAQITAMNQQGIRNAATSAAVNEARLEAQKASDLAQSKEYVEAIATKKAATLTTDVEANKILVKDAKLWRQIGYTSAQIARERKLGSSQAQRENAAENFYLNTLNKEAAAKAKISFLDTQEYQNALKTIILAREKERILRKQIEDEVRISLGVAKTTKNKKEEKKDTKETAKNTRNIREDAERTQRAVAKTVISRGTILMLVRRTAMALKNAVKLSADWEENLNLFAVTYGEGYEEMIEWSIKFSEQLGYSSVDIVKYTGLFKQLSDAIGVAGETGKQLASTLTQIGADISSFYNISLESAMEKLQAGIYSGQTKPLRAVGIDVTYQSIDNLLKTNEELAKLQTTSKRLSQDQKVLARAILVTTAATNAWADSAITINSFANQVKVLQGSIKNLGLAIGDWLKEPLRDVLIGINGIIMALTAIVRTFAKMNTEVQREISDMATTTADEYADLSEEINGLLSFDKFEVLQQSDTKNLDATAILTEELNKTMSEYLEKQEEAMKNISNAATIFRDKVLEVLGYKWEGNKLVKVNNTLTSIVNTVIALIGLGLASRIVKLGTTIVSSFSLLKFSVFALVIQVVDLFSRLNDLSNAQKIVRIACIALTAAVMVLSLKNKLLATSTVASTVALKSMKLKTLDAAAATKILYSTMAKLVVIGGLVSLMAVSVFENFDKMDNFQKVISILGLLTTAVVGLAYAMGVLKAVSTPLKVGAIIAAVAGVGAVIGTTLSVKKYADGGTPERGELFSMNEYGRPEAFVKSGGQTSVINDVTMGSLMKQGVIEAFREMGVVEAIRESGANISIEGDAEKIFKVVEKEGKRVYGKGWR